MLRRYAAPALGVLKNTSGFFDQSNGGTVRAAATGEGTLLGPPGEVDTRTSLEALFGWSRANCWAMTPPIENPRTVGRRRCRARITPATSSPICLIDSPLT